MFQHPQESALAPMRDKLLFIEALVASRELTGRELRVAILLVSFYSTANGYAKPSMERIAAALGIDKSDVCKAIKSLDVKGWFFVEHGNFRLGGKGHVNHYRPNAGKLSSANPLMDAARRAEERRAEQRGAPMPPFKDGNESVREKPKGGKTPPNRGKIPSQRGVPPPTDPDSDPDSTDPAVLRTASPSDEGDAYAPPQFAVLKKLKGIEAWLKADTDRTLTISECKTVQGWLDDCDQLCEEYHSHTGHPIGGMAQRLGDELSWLLQRDGDSRARTATSEMTEEEFEQRRQQILRELEGIPPPKSNGPAFGAWVEEECLRRRVPPEHIADALGVTVDQLALATRGHGEWTRYQRKRVITALNGYAPNGPAL